MATFEPDSPTGKTKVSSGSPGRTIQAALRVRRARTKEVVAAGAMVTVFTRRLAGMTSAGTVGASQWTLMLAFAAVGG